MIHSDQVVHGPAAFAGYVVIVGVILIGIAMALTGPLSNHARESGILDSSKPPPEEPTS